MPPSWVVLDCGDTIEVISEGCGGTRTRTAIPKKPFLESAWQDSSQSYVRDGSTLLDASGFPMSVKDALERLRLANNLTDKRAEFQRKVEMWRAAQKPANRLIVLGFVCLLTGVLTSNVIPYQGGYRGDLLLVTIFLFLLCFIISFRMTAKAAVWVITTEERIFLKLADAIENLNRYVRSGGTDRASFVKSLHFLRSVPMPPSSTGTGYSWKLAENARMQMRRIPRVIVTGIVPFIENEKSDVSKFGRVISGLSQLLPLLIFPDVDEVERWSDMAEKQWPKQKKGVQTWNTIRNTVNISLKNMWLQIIVLLSLSVAALVGGSRLEGVDILLYFKSVYWQFLTLVAALLMGYAAIKWRK